MPTPPNRRVASLPNVYDIVSNSLVFSLDAGDPISYPGSGTTWFDQTGQLLDATGSLTYSNNNGGYFEVNNNNFSIPDNALIDLTGARTLTAWFYLGADTSGAGIAGKADSSVNGLALGYGWSGGGFMALAWNSSNSPALAKNLSRDVGKWVYLAAVVTPGGDRIIYAFDDQGVRSASSGAASQSWNNSLNFGIGAANGAGTSRVPNGSRFGYVSVYSSTLTENELLFNFNATRWRFGV
jgi:hypothetical protein